MLNTNNFVDRSKIKPLVLGVAGVAGAGKDTFFKCLERQIQIKRYSFADILKEEVKDECLDRFGIDPTNCSRSEKGQIRDYLVSYAKEKRESTDGRYFINKLYHKIKTEGDLNSNICITDVRYADYPLDEVHFIKKELEGFLVYIKKHKFSLDGCSVVDDPPANEEEERNNPRLLKSYDYIIDWEHVYKSTEAEIEKAISYHVSDFLICLKRDIRSKGIKINLQ